MATQNNIPDWIFSKHPHYKDYAEEVAECFDFYMGGKNISDNSSKYLKRHISEKSSVYEGRRQLLYYDNKIAELVDTLYYYIFQSGAELKRTGGELLEKDDIRYILDDIDGGGTSIDKFMIKIGIDAAVNGLSFIYVEPLKSIDVDPEIGLNVSDVLKNDLVPRFKNLPRSNVENWNVNSNGEPTFVKLKFKALNENMTYLDDESKRYFNIVILWEKLADNICKWSKYNADTGALIKEQIVNLPFIPIIPCYGKKLADWEGAPLISSAKDFAKILYNIDNQRLNFVNFSATYQICFPVSDIAFKDSVSKMMKGDEYYWTVPVDGVPQILQNPTMPYDILLRERNEVIIPGIYQNLKQRLQAATAEYSAASGESKKADFQVTNAEISFLARGLQDVENRAFFIQMAYINSNPETIRQTAIKVRYPANFNIHEINSRFDEIVNAERVNMPPEYINMKKKTVIQSDPDYMALSDMEQMIIDNAVEEMPLNLTVAGVEKTFTQAENQENQNLQMAESFGSEK